MCERMPSRSGRGGLCGQWSGRGGRAPTAGPTGRHVIGGGRGPARRAALPAVGVAAPLWTRTPRDERRGRVNLPAARRALPRAGGGGGAGALGIRRGGVVGSARDRARQPACGPALGDRAWGGGDRAAPRGGTLAVLAGARPSERRPEVVGECPGLD